MSQVFHAASFSEKEVSKNLSQPGPQMADIVVHVGRVRQVTEAARRVERHDPLLIELAEILVSRVGRGQAKRCIEVLVYPNLCVVRAGVGDALLLQLPNISLHPDD